MKKLGLLLLLLSSYALAAETVSIPQSGGKAKLTHASGKFLDIETVMTTDGNGNLIPISGGGGGDATAANQVTGNNSLAAIDAKHPGDVRDAGNSVWGGFSSQDFPGVCTSTLGYKAVNVVAQNSDPAGTIGIGWYQDSACTEAAASDAIENPACIPPGCPPPSAIQLQSKNWRVKGPYYRISSAGGVDSFIEATLKVNADETKPVEDLASMLAKITSINTQLSDVVDAGNTHEGSIGDTVWEGTCRTSLGFEALSIRAFNVSAPSTCESGFENVTVNWYRDSGCTNLVAPDVLSNNSNTPGPAGPATALDFNESLRIKGDYYKITANGTGGCDNATIYPTLKVRSKPSLQDDIIVNSIVEVDERIGQLRTDHPGDLVDDGNSIVQSGATCDGLAGVVRSTLGYSHVEIFQAFDYAGAPTVNWYADAGEVTTIASEPVWNVGPPPPGAAGVRAFPVKGPYYKITAGASVDPCTAIISATLKSASASFQFINPGVNIDPGGLSYQAGIAASLMYARDAGSGAFSPLSRGATDPEALRVEDAATAAINAAQIDGSAKVQLYQSSVAGEAIGQDSTNTVSNGPMFPIGGVWLNDLSGFPPCPPTGLCNMVSQMTVSHGIHTSLRTEGGVELGTIGAPLVIDIGASSFGDIPVTNGALTSLDGKFSSLGQNTMAASTPVVIASDQSAIPVTGTFFQATQPVSGTFFQATQPVSIATLPALAAGTNSIGTVSVSKFSRSDTYTATGSGTAVDASAAPVKAFAVQVVGTGGAATLWDVRIECSLDGTNFDTSTAGIVAQNTNTDGDQTVRWNTADKPCRYFRSRTSGLTLGGATNIVVTILGLQ